MDLYEALEITKEYQNVGAPSDGDEFMLIEALTYLIDYYGDTFDGSVYMYNLGDHYLRRGEFSLAKKYLERCLACDNEVANVPLGTIWYYGLTGELNYEKAFNCFSSAEDFPQSKLMLAEMYKEGQYVEADMKKYRQYIFDAFEQVWDSPVPTCKGEAFYKYAEIVMEEEKNGNRREEIAVLLIQADSNQQDQMMHYASDRDYEIMKNIKMLLYKLNPELEMLNIFDMYWALSKPASVKFIYPELDGAEFGEPEHFFPAEEHFISSHPNGSTLEILFDDEWYRDIDHFFRSATLYEQRMAEISYLLTDFEYVEMP